MRKLCLLLSLALLLLQAPAHAWLFHKKTKPDRAGEIQTFQPPPAATMTEVCEPLRQKVVLYNSAPRRERMKNRMEVHRLKKQYEKCQQEFSKAEYNYLKHAQEPASPSLPAMDASAPPVVPVTPSAASPEPSGPVGPQPGES